MKVLSQAKLVSGWAMLLLGALGLVLPIVPGVPFLLAGLAMLSWRYTWGRKTIKIIRRKGHAACRRLASIVGK